MISSSFSTFLDHHDLAAEAIMLRAAANHTLLIVEGPSDYRFISKFKHELCDVIVGHGKDNALAALAEIERRGMRGVLCLLDRDFSDFFGAPSESVNVVYTDQQDAEMQLIASPAYESVVHELASPGKLEKVGMSPESVRELIGGIAAEVGLLRFVSAKHGLNLSFEGVRLRCLDHRAMTLERDALVKEALANTKGHNLRKKDILALMDAEAGTSTFHNGHDFCVLTGLALRAFIGSRNAIETSAETIQSRLRIGYSAAYFSVSKMYQDIKDWEARNVPYLVLAF